MNPSPETRYSLIEKIKDPQDADAWNEFASIYQPLIFKICLSKGIQHADATDVTQEVLTRVSNVIAKFRHEQSGATFRGWLYRITRNMMVDFFRQKKNNPLDQAERPLELRHDFEPKSEESREFQVEFQRQMFIVVAKTVQSQVKPETWKAFWLTEMERRSVDEVAVEIGLTAGAIYVARSRVIARLKKEVQQRLSETGHSLMIDNNNS